MMNENTPLPDDFRFFSSSAICAARSGVSPSRICKAHRAAICWFTGTSSSFDLREFGFSPGPPIALATATPLFAMNPGENVPDLIVCPSSTLCWTASGLGEALRIAPKRLAWSSGEAVLSGGFRSVGA